MATTCPINTGKVKRQAPPPPAAVNPMVRSKSERDTTLNDLMSQRKSLSLSDLRHIDRPISSCIVKFNKNMDRVVLFPNTAALNEKKLVNLKNRALAFLNQQKKLFKQSPATKQDSKTTTQMDDNEDDFIVKRVELVSRTLSVRSRSLRRYHSMDQIMYVEEELPWIEPVECIKLGAEPRFIRDYEIKKPNNEEPSVRKYIKDKFKAWKRLNKVKEQEQQEEVKSNTAK